MRVPDGWFEYSRFGTPIDATGIIAVKTPLKERFNTGTSARHGVDYQRGVPLEEEFTPLQMLQQFKERGWKVGLVIDLTFTNRYYEPKEFVCQGVRHLKIKCPGHMIPPDDIYQQLSVGLSEFLSDPHNTGALVAVHCTHGLNRTGYLVCRYLIEHCGYDVERAIQAFNTGRGHNIERQNYLEHLRKGCPKDEGKLKTPEKPTHSLATPDHTHKKKMSPKGKHLVGACAGGSLVHSDAVLPSSYAVPPSPPRFPVEEEREGPGRWEGDLRAKLDHKAKEKRRKKKSKDSEERYDVRKEHGRGGNGSGWEGGRRRRRGGRSHDLDYGTADPWGRHRMEQCYERREQYDGYHRWTPHSAPLYYYNEGVHPAYYEPHYPMGVESVDVWTGDHGGHDLNYRSQRSQGRRARREERWGTHH